MTFQLTEAGPRGIHSEEAMIDIAHRFLGMDRLKTFEVSDQQGFNFKGVQRMGMMSGGWLEDEDTRYDSMHETKNKDSSTPLEDYEFSTQRRSEDRNQLEDYEPRKKFK